MLKKNIDGVQTEANIRKRAVKLVIVHLKKKTSKDFLGSEHVKKWLYTALKMVSPSML